MDLKDQVSAVRLAEDRLKQVTGRVAEQDKSAEALFTWWTRPNRSWRWMKWLRRNAELKFEDISSQRCRLVCAPQ